MIAGMMTPIFLTTLRVGIIGKQCLGVEDARTGDRFYFWCLRQNKQFLGSK